METNRATALHLNGVTLPDGELRDLFVVNGRITFRPPDEVSSVFRDGFILPGLVDAHAHLALASPADPDEAPEEQVRASARAHLSAGVLLIREPGSPDRLSKCIGPHEGLPRVISGGRFLTPPGTYFPGLAREVAEEDLPDAAEEEARASGAWAKVIGDWVGPDGRMRSNYRTATLAAAVARVHAIGARIAIHAICTEAIEAAIEAGFDSIEHGQGIQEDHLAAMAERSIAFVPTLTILPDLPGVIADLGLKRSAREAMLSAVTRHPEMTRRAAETGVLVLAGTDAGMGPHGMVHEEIRLLLDAGLSPEASLAAGSWAARRFLGLPCLEEGAPADIVAYRDDPRGAPDVLMQPSLRILDGRVV